MTTPKDTKNFGALMDRTLKIIKQNYLQAFREAGVDITTEQWVLLDRLMIADGISQTELASDSFKNAPTVSRIIELLRQKGLIKKKQSSDDKRQFLIFLTEEGRTLHSRALPRVLALRSQGWHGLDDVDYGHFVRIMSQIEKNFSEPD
ncbi:MAG: MarR family transcriptional regulator [Bacteroidetes bacterium]|nr:MAG: MarR family transcriptional regulator [Bacteroidota bacterium]PTM13487.1 MAG: MarR family transcriptional regulator [Bacteroidota bacterium]